MTVETINPNKAEMYKSFYLHQQSYPDYNVIWFSTQVA